MIYTWRLASAKLVGGTPHNLPWNFYLASSTPPIAAAQSNALRQ